MVIDNVINVITIPTYRLFEVLTWFDAACELPGLSLYVISANPY